MTATELFDACHAKRRECKFYGLPEPKRLTLLVPRRATGERMREAAHDMTREWRLHGQLTDSCRPMERLLGIHAPFCPVHSRGDCECDLSRAALAKGDDRE